MKTKVINPELEVNNTPTDATERTPHTSCIIEALDFIQEEASDSGLSDEFWESVRPETDYLAERLQLTAREAVLLAVICEIGGDVSWSGLGSFLNVSRLKAMAFSPEVESLKLRRMLKAAAVRERGGRYEGFSTVYGVIGAFRADRNYEPERLSGFNTQALLDRLLRFIVQEGADDDIPPRDNLRWMTQLIEDNPDLEVSKVFNGLKHDDSRFIFMHMIADAARYDGLPDEGLGLPEFSGLMRSEWNFDRMASTLMDGRHELIKTGVLEYACSDGMTDTQKYVVTDAVKKQCLQGYERHLPRKKNKDNDVALRKPEDISAKSLAYTPQVGEQVDRLRRLFSAESLNAVQDRLAEGGLRRGIACLFYGAPGTGKTETVMQLARETGREVFAVEIAGIKDKFVGESEKNIKEIFNRYRAACQSGKPIPILLFNEADALFNTRMEKTESSVDKMNNAMQNIILQEIENLDGIMVATTNLTGTLDFAMERRFLFKIRFERPDAPARQQIWRSMMPSLDAADADELGRRFDLSGAQIENVARKCAIEYALSGERCSLELIIQFCREETADMGSRTQMGFLPQE